MSNAKTWSRKREQQAASASSCARRTTLRATLAHRAASFATAYYADGVAHGAHKLISNRQGRFGARSTWASSWSGSLSLFLLCFGRRVEAIVCLRSVVAVVSAGTPLPRLSSTIAFGIFCRFFLFALRPWTMYARWLVTLVLANMRAPRSCVFLIFFL